jgi:DNA polymerase-2
MNAAIAAYIRKTYDLQSRLELEFEKAYRRFLLPTARGTDDKGRAKAYAGLRADGKKQYLEITGMEAVRSDWTEMVHAFQRELLDKIFHDRTPEQIEAFVSQWLKRIRAGEMDTQLVYRKRLRKPLDAYTKTTPPHVKAARLMEKPTDVIRYVVTTRGPQPLERRTAPIDYRHYIDRQVAPILKMLAHLRGIDADTALSGEPRLFRFSADEMR